MKNINERILHTWNGIVILFILLSILLLPRCIYDSITESVCCSKIIEFSTPYEWVCPAEKCPGGVEVYINLANICYFIPEGDDYRLGDVSLYFEIAGKDVLYDDIGSKLTHYDNIYYESQNRIYIPIDKTSTIILKLDGVNCPEDISSFADIITEERILVNVVEQGSIQELCFLYKVAPDFTHTEPVKGSWVGNFDIFGPGVVIEGIVNPIKNGVSINIKHDGIEEQNIKPGKMTSNAFHGSDPNGMWIIDIPSKAEYYTFLNSGQDLCLIIYLTCIC